MNKFLKLSTVSILAIVATANAYAAGYTCEELIEYTSCNPGYYLSSGANCPSGYDFVSGFCGGPGDGLIYSDVTEEECYTRVSEDWGEDITSDPEGYGIYHIQYACVSRENSEEYYAVSMSSQCLDCPIGSTCAGGTAGAKLCTKGSYCAGTNLTQPTGTCTSGTFAPEGSVSCISCPEHKYVNSTGQTISVSATSAVGAGSVTCSSFVSKSF